MLEKRPTPTRANDVGGTLLLLAIAVAWTRYHWLKLFTLMSGDSVRWLHEAQRAAAGELIYRDFASMYPPVGIESMALAYLTFGRTFLVTQLTLCLLSLTTVFLMWRLSRRLLAEPLALATAVAFAVVGAANTGNFSLFSLDLYTPGQLTGFVGATLALAGTLELVAGRRDGWTLASVWVGVPVAILSKLEFLPSLVAALGVAALSDRHRTFAERPLRQWSSFWARILLGSLAPAVVVLGVLALAVGGENLRVALGGYGVIERHCPWWPTGLGLLGAVASLGQAIGLWAIASLTRYRAYRAQWGSRYWLLLGAAPVGFALWIVHLPYATRTLGYLHGNVGAVLPLTYALSVSGMLLPVLWLTIFAYPWLVKPIWTAWRTGHAASYSAVATLILATAAALLNLRNLFDQLYAPVTTVNQAAYPALFVLGAYSIVRALDPFPASTAGRTDTPTARPVDYLSPPSRLAAIAVVGVMLSFGAVRWVGRVWIDRHHVYQRLDTLAGPVYVADQESARAYQYIVSQTAPDDRIVELPLGGSLHFATGRISPLFATQFRGLSPPDSFLARDLERLEKQPPSLLIGTQAPQFGAEYGIPNTCGCVFPRLVFEPDQPAYVPGKVFPALQRLQADYHPVRRFGSFVAFAPNHQAMK